MAASPASDKVAAGEEEKGTSPVSMAASPDSDKVAAGNEEKEPTSPAGWSPLRALVLVLVAAAAVGVPTFLLVRFHGHPISQVWIMSLSICSYVYFFLLCIWRSRWFYTEFARLSYGPLLAFFSASAIGPATAVFILFFSTVWAAGNLGYSLAVHRIRNGTEPAIHALPIPTCSTKDTIERLNFNLYTGGAPFAALLWTLFVAFVVYVASITDELCILMILSYFGWIHVTVWLFFVALVPMHGVLIGERMEWLLSALPTWMGISPLICLVSGILSAVLCHLLLMIALVAFLWYNLAIYMHYLETATPSTTTQGNEDTLQSEIQQDNIWQVKSDPTHGETPSKTCSYSTAV